LTNRQFADALNAGAYLRFSQCQKTISAGHKNRQVPAAVHAEFRLFQATQDEMMKRFGGVVVNGVVEYPPEVAAEANAAHAEWMRQTIDLPGEKVRISDIVSGGLLESDYALLESFLGD